MKKILSFALIAIFLFSAFAFAGCDYEKKYSAQDISEMHISLTTNDETKSFFDTNKTFNITWSDKIMAEMSSANSMLTPLNDVFAPLITISFESYNRYRDNISNDFSKSDLTKIYNQLKSFYSQLKAFSTRKIALEEEMNSYSGGELTNMQTNRFDILFDSSKKLLSSALKLGKSTVSAIIDNTYENFYSEENVTNPQWHHLKAYSLSIQLDLVKVAYEYDIKSLWMPLNREFLYDTEITSKVIELNTIYRQKESLILSNTDYSFSQEYTSQMSTALSKHSEMSANSKIYFKALKKVDFEKMHKNKTTLSNYLENLSVGNKANLNIVNNYNNQYVPFIIHTLKNVLLSV